MKTFTIALTMAWRNLWRNKRRTLIMLSAIIIGVWAMLFMTAFMRGMVDSMLTQGINKLPGHVQIHHRQYLADPVINHTIMEPDLDLINKLSHPLIKSWSTRIEVNGIIASERDNRGVMIVAIDHQREPLIGFNPNSITQGQYFDEQNYHGIIIGQRLAQLLETKLGKRVVLMTQSTDNDISERGFKISGIYQTSPKAEEEAIIYVDKRVLQKMLGLTQQVTEIAIAGHSIAHTETLHNYVNSLNLEADVQSWQTLQAYLYSMLAMMDGMVLVMIIIIFIALSFGLANTLVMAIFERTREIGLLQALGLKSAFIRHILLIESLLLLIIGLSLGNLIGLAHLDYLATGIDFSAFSEGMEMAGLQTTIIPTLKQSDQNTANAIVIIMGMLAALLPAIRAAKLDPIVALNKH
ncbi:ABC transporter permease [Paraferrimonas sp. SM1919]|uniref:ABC transporter permease n=1 Tax=Paraferrimonas sp. SM1919 TaxID=2662263 RepID=UPI0013D66023|nr:ABC transporter permease [Paraferrimonas sp. SM1919]